MNRPARSRRQCNRKGRSRAAAVTVVRPVVEEAAVEPRGPLSVRILGLDHEPERVGRAVLVEASAGLVGAVRLLPA
jgi:hypothetical protein